MINSIDISIIIPVFNGDSFINKAYYNILEQNIKFFEIIFIDNNSTDSSDEIIKQIVEKDERVKLFHQLKKGAAAARNLGLSKSKGKYVYFFDVDDIILKNALNSMLNILKETSEIDTVFGAKSEFKDEINYSNSEIIIKKPPYWGEKWFNNFSILNGPPGFLHRKENILVNEVFPENLLLGEDAAFHIKLGLESNLAYLDAPVYYYNRHDSSTTSLEKKRISLSEKYFIQYSNYYLPKVLNKVVPFNLIEKDVINKTLGQFGGVLVEKETIKERYNKYQNLKKMLGSYKIPILININYFLIIIFGSKLLHKVILTRLLKVVY